MINISDSALTHLKGLITDQSEASAPALRVFVQPGGCSGFSYGMGLDENQPKEDDEDYDINGIHVYVDQFSAGYLDGAEIDYVDAMMGGGFTIHNPNAVSTCGCGHSFQTPDQEGQPKACSH